MKKRIFLLAALAAGLVLCLAACGETNGDPVTVTLWHVYGGEVNSPMNALVEEFNRTVGQEQGIRVRVDSVSNSGVIHESVLAAAYKDPGAPELPDLFVSYPKTVLALPDENILADYRDYFTDEELEGDEMLPAAVDVILETGQASVSMLQRRLKLGYARAARIMDEMEERGIVGPFEGSKPRQLLITREQWQAIKDGAPISSEPVEEEIP